MVYLIHCKRRFQRWSSGSLIYCCRPKFEIHSSWALRFLEDHHRVPEDQWYSVESTRGPEILCRKYQYLVEAESQWWTVIEASS